MNRLVVLALLVAAVDAMPFDILDGNTTATYSDPLARNYFYPLAASAYINPAACVQNSIQGTVKRQVSVECDPIKADTCSGYTAVSQSHKAVAVVFRGTDTDLQLLDEIGETLEQMIAFGKGNVNKYFFDAFTALWNGGMKDDFLFLRSRFPSYDVWVTGHSLGGAMSAIAANHLVLNVGVPANQLKHISFGEPRVGDQQFADGHDALLPYSFRVVHQNDIAAHIPLALEGYHHHKTEIWYNNNMATADFKVCAEQEDKTCSDGHLDISVDEHHTYFDHHMADWINKGCVGQ